MYVVLFIVWKCYIYDWKRSKSVCFFSRKEDGEGGEEKLKGGGEGEVEMLNEKDRLSEDVFLLYGIFVILIFLVVMLV